MPSSAALASAALARSRSFKDKQDFDREKGNLVDDQVRFTQQWLNSTYGSKAGWVLVDEDGYTGWGTIYALRRALQAELGISPLSSGFGPSTSAAFQAQVGVISATSANRSRILRILSGALWCKGYAAYAVTSASSRDPFFSEVASAVAIVRYDLGLTTSPDASTATVDVKIMASLLSMDSYTTLLFYGGTNAVRSIQQWLNRTFATRRDFMLGPTDGVCSRQTTTAMLYAIQYTLGMADGVANGNFGPGTRSGLSTLGPLSAGTSGRATELLQASLTLNGFTTAQTGVLDEQSRANLKSFQNLMEIETTAIGDYRTWCNLLVSCGDTSMPTKGLDTATRLSASVLSSARTKGYTHIGRYLAGTGKSLTPEELTAFRDQGVLLIPIQQRSNDSLATMTRANGLAQGVEAAQRANLFGLPRGSTIYFAIDFDPTIEAIKGPVFDFMRGVKDAMDALYHTRYLVGVYGTRNVCQKLISEQLATSCYVSGMSTGYSGNLGVPMPSPWAYNQIVEVQEAFGPTNVAVDHVVVSRNAVAVEPADLVPPPTTTNGPAGILGSDALLQWVALAEILGERTLIEAAGPTHQRACAESSHWFMLNYLRKAKYHSVSWDAYLQEIQGVEPQFGSASTFYEMGLANMVDPATPSITVPYPPETVDARQVSSKTPLDVSHWAASTLGYRAWGLPAGPAVKGAGDLGAWGLDLLQVWGAYERAGKPAGLYAWALARIGVDDASGLGQRDLIADADAYLTAIRLSGAPQITPMSTAPAVRLSDSLRRQFMATPKERVIAFYAWRFNRSADNLSAAFQDLTQGWLPQTPIVGSWTRDNMLELAQADLMPTPAEADVLARAFAAVLASPPF